MATPQQQEAQQPQKPPQRRPSPRITDVIFRDSASFNSGASTAAVGERNVVSILPGSVNSAGYAATSDDAGDRPSDGLLVALKVRGTDNQMRLETYLVPWSNVRDVKFEAVDLAPPVSAA